MRLIRGFAPIARDEAAGDVIAETLKIRRSGDGRPARAALSRTRSRNAQMRAARRERLGREMSAVTLKIRRAATVARARFSRAALRKCQNSHGRSARRGDAGMDWNGRPARAPEGSFVYCRVAERPNSRNVRPALVAPATAEYGTLNSEVIAFFFCRVVAMSKSAQRNDV